MEDRKLEAAESLALIGRMIENTRSRMVRNSGRPLLAWGYATVLTTLAVWGAVLYFQNPRWNYLWLHGDPLSPARPSGRSNAVAGKIPLIDLADIETCIHIAQWARARVPCTPHPARIAGLRRQRSTAPRNCPILPISRSGRCTCIRTLYAK